MEILIKDEMHFEWQSLLIYSDDYIVISKHIAEQIQTQEWERTGFQFRFINCVEVALSHNEPFCVLMAPPSNEGGVLFCLLL